MQVTEARTMLSQKNQSMVTKISCRQAARVLLNHQEQCILEMIGEGLLKPADAAVFFELIRNDTLRLDEDRFTDLRFDDIVFLELN